MMKIWYQSDAPIGFDPLWKVYERSLRKHIDEVKLPNTVVDLHGVDHKNSEVEPQDKKPMHHQIINNALVAQKSNYDVFAVGCTLDPGRSEIRKLINIPSAFIGESSMVHACALGRKVSIVARTGEVIPKFEENIRDYGVHQNISEIGHLSLTLNQLVVAFNNPKPVVEEFLKESKRLIQKGAEVILPGCGVLNIILTKNRVDRIDHVVIVDTTAVLIKTAEFLGILRKG